MRVWGAIFNIFAVLMMLLMSFAFLNLTRVLDRDFDQARLNKAVEYSTEATFINTLEIEDIGLDYTDIEAIEINTGNSLDIFETMMCFNYDLSVHEENKKLIEDSVATMVLSCNDGFYIIQDIYNDTGKGEYLLRWSPKIPYLYDDGSNKYAFNVVKQKWAKVSGSGDIEMPLEEGYPPGISHDKVLEVLNEQITRNIYVEIENRNANRDIFQYKFFLPAETTRAGVNPISGPGILTLIQGARFASKEMIGTVSVSGYKVVEKVNVVAFTEKIDGVDKKFYCYEGQMDIDDIDTKYKVKNYYRDTRTAAKEEYSPHFGLMTKKITKR